jgi:hypothetical protein
MRWVSKSVTHIIGVLKMLRREMTSKNQFCTHISRGWCSGRGV